MLYLFVPCPDLSIEFQSFLGFVELPSVQQVSTDHHTSPTFSCFAVNGCNMLLVFTQPLIQILTKGPDQFQLRGVVVFKGVLGHCQRTRQVSEREQEEQRERERTERERQKNREREQREAVSPDENGSPITSSLAALLI